MAAKNDYVPPGWSSDDVWLNSQLAEAKGHLDALAAILWRLQCNVFDREFEAIRKVMAECWKGR